MELDISSALFDASLKTPRSRSIRGGFFLFGIRFTRLTPSGGPGDTVLRHKTDDIARPAPSPIWERVEVRAEKIQDHARDRRAVRSRLFRLTGESVGTSNPCHP